MRTVVSLCADWCGGCHEYRPVFEAFARAHPGARFRWRDIEDDAAVAGDIDIETFPTVLVADGATVRFYGPLLPRAAALQAALRSADAGAMAVGPEVAALARRLLARGG